MEGTISRIIGRFLIVYGLLISAFIISGLVEIKEFEDIKQYSAAIFNTNCHFLIKSIETCSNISSLLIALFIVSGILVAIFYKTFSMIFTSITLIVLSIFFCNPKIDSSFHSFIHFIQVCICVAGLLFLTFKPNKQKS